MRHGEGSIKGTGAAKQLYTVNIKSGSHNTMNIHATYIGWKEAIGEYNFTFKNT